MSWIDSYNIVTSPYRSYIQVPSYEMGYFKISENDIKYETLSTAFIIDNPTNRRTLEETLRQKGVILRFTTDYWPRLEEPAWQVSNNIRPYKSA